MLTGDLVRVRRRKEGIVPRYVTGEAVERLLPIARSFTSIFASLIGAPREEIESTIASVAIPARDRVAALGLRKVIEDRAEFDSPEGPDPEALRREVFLASANAHKALDVKGTFDRSEIIAKVAEARSASPSDVEGWLYSDLKGREVLKSFDALPPEEVIVRYNLGLAQALLLRATHVTVRFSGEDPARVRRLFRAARFHGLLHVVRRDEEGRTILELDGPFSLFDAVQRYGLKLAVFLPSILALDAYEIQAAVLWGKERIPEVFTITPADGLVASVPDPPSLTPELEQLTAAFARLESPWSVKPCDQVFALPGEVACVPDLVFENRETKESVYLEAFGFWSRAAVWQRVELLRKGFPARMILAVGKHLRVSEEVLSEDDAGEIYVYKQTISPRAILERLGGQGK